MRAPAVVGGRSSPELTWARREGRKISPWGGTTTRGLGLKDPAGLRRACRCLSRSTDRMPQRSGRQRAGCRGEAFVDMAVSDAGHVWNDTKRDFAIDSQIEFVEAGREVTGVAVLAQVKGTEVGFRGATETEFKFPCKADHISYWLRLGRPVVLICVDLRVQQAWWKRVDTWFANPERKARRDVQFDKAADRFDLDAVSRLSAPGAPAGEPLPRLEGNLPAGPGARELTAFFAGIDGIDAQLDAVSASAPKTQRNDRDVLNLLTKRAKVLHLGPANYCWFTDPSQAL
ncbi:DUF4365 domain-containing protein [Streptomyces sp. NPDC091215]|uniref:DUF4365 domain-containing protein n=1 Tax=Streptomyces sp. NPDC091215 TaxID=3155192 RepID=UPI00341669D1